MKERYGIYLSDDIHIPQMREFDIPVKITDQMMAEGRIPLESKKEEVKQFRIILGAGKGLILYLAICHEAKAVSIEGAEVIDL